MKYQDIEVGIDYEPEPGLADNGDLARDLDSGQNQSSTFIDSNYDPWRRQQKLLSLR